MRGEDDVDEDGDGGPRLDVGTSAWGEGPTVVGDPSDCENEEGTAVGGESACSDSKFGRTLSGESGGESGGAAEAGISREMRFVVETDRPAFWRERMRSAMLPPLVLTIVPLASSSTIDDLECGR